MMSETEQYIEQISWKAYPNREDVAKRAHMTKTLETLVDLARAEMIQQVFLDWKQVQDCMR